MCDFFSFQDIYLVDIQICYFFVKFPSPVVSLYLFLFFFFLDEPPSVQELKIFLVINHCNYNSD